MSRRALSLTLSIVLLVCGGCVGLGTFVWTRMTLNTAGRIEFVNPLTIPPLAPSTVDEDGRRVFDLTAAPGVHDFGQGAVPTWGFNGGYLGPTLRAARGEQVVVQVHNALPDTTTVHWHGMHLSATMDGGPHQTVAPGSTWSPTWRIDQPSATLWYHPHPHGETANQVYRGLAGMFILDDRGAEISALPHRYGVDDIPVIVQDKQFTDAGELDEGSSFLGGIGILGDTIAVNGTVAPYLDIETERARLRLLNASNARSYEFGFADDRAFSMVASDGGLLAAPYVTDRIALSPGERAEIVVTMRPGERAVLRSTPPPLGLDPLSRRFSGGADTLDILQLRAADRLAASASVPQRLADVPRLRAPQPVQRRSFHLGDETVNGQRMDMSRIDATVTRDTTEIWRLENNDGTPHNFHIHGVQFQVLAVGGRTPPPQLLGYKDTLFLNPNVPYEIIVPFGSFADAAAPFMFHCHVLYHEDQGMMGQFVVVNSGQPATTPVGHRHS